MREEIKKDSEAMFNHFGRHYTQNPNTYKAATTLIGLVGAFSSNGTPESIQEDVTLLSNRIINLRILEELLGTVGHYATKRLQWSPDFQRENIPQQLTLSPNFNVASEELVVGEISKIRLELTQSNIDYSKIIGWISKRATEEGFNVICED